MEMETKVKSELARGRLGITLKDSLENIDIAKGILKNIDIDKISCRYIRM